MKFRGNAASCLAQYATDIRGLRIARSLKAKMKNIQDPEKIKNIENLISQFNEMERNHKADKLEPELHRIYASIASDVMEELDARGEISRAELAELVKSKIPQEEEQLISKLSGVINYADKYDDIEALMN